MEKRDSNGLVLLGRCFFILLFYFIYYFYYLSHLFIISLPPPCTCTHRLANACFYVPFSFVFSPDLRDLAWHLGPMADRAKDPEPGGLISPYPATVSRSDTKDGGSKRRSSASSSSSSSPRVETAAEDTAVSSWWFASTAIPLLAATTGPLSNVLSIAALVTPWRVALLDNGQLPLGTDDNGVGIPDPHWYFDLSHYPFSPSPPQQLTSHREIILNALSLACGFTGNFFLLLNFTGRVRYIVALPLSIIFWVLSSIIVRSAKPTLLLLEIVADPFSLTSSSPSPRPCTSMTRPSAPARFTHKVSGMLCWRPSCTLPAASCSSLTCSAMCAGTTRSGSTSTTTSVRSFSKPCCFSSGWLLVQVSTRGSRAGPTRTHCTLPMWYVRNGEVEVLEQPIYTDVISPS